MFATMLNNPLVLILALVAIVVAYGIYVIVYWSTPENRLKRPRDPAQLTKLMIDIASRKVENRQPPPSLEGKDAAASTLGRRVQVGLLICHNQSRAWENLRYCGVLEARERPRTD
jgi:hypothetical protein